MEEVVSEFHERRAMWQGHRILVTGHTGFKGTWLAHWLTRLGAEVVGFSLGSPVSHPALFELTGLASALHSHLIGDIREYTEIEAALQKSAPEVVFHLAAQPLVRAGYREPVATFATNVMGTVHVLEAVRRTPSVRAVVVCTTDKCYENSSTAARPFVETDRLGGFDPYASSKAAAELVAAAYRRSFFAGADVASVATVRAGNVIGGGDFAEDRLIPDLIRHWGNGEVAAIRNPTAQRPWQHVLEPLNGYMLVAERMLRDGAEVAEAWNFGPDLRDIRSVGWVADKLHKALNGGSWAVDGGSYPHEAMTLALDCGKARDRLGWTSRWDLTTAIQRTALWYRGWKDSSDPESLMDADLDAYMSTPVHDRHA